MPENRCTICGPDVDEAVQLLRGLKRKKLDDGGVITDITLTITDRKTKEKLTIEI